MTDRPFAFVAWGGCGTHWLARELGKAPGWRVECEPAPNDQRDLMRRYEHGGARYGEVNAKARHVAHFASVFGANVVGIRRRDRYAQLRSCFLLNGWTGPSAEAMLSDFGRTEAALREMEREGRPIYEFERLVDESTGDLGELAEMLGVPIDLGAVDWTAERRSKPGDLDPAVDAMLRAHAGRP